MAGLMSQKRWIIIRTMNITPTQMITKMMIIIKGPDIIGQYGSLHPMVFSSATPNGAANTGVGAHRPSASGRSLSRDSVDQPLKSSVSAWTLASDSSRSATEVCTGTPVPPDASRRPACTSGSVWKISTSFL